MAVTVTRYVRVAYKNMLSRTYVLFALIGTPTARQNRSCSYGARQSSLPYDYHIALIVERKSELGAMRWRGGGGVRRGASCGQAGSFHLGLELTEAVTARSENKIEQRVAGMNSRRAQ